MEAARGHDDVAVPPSNFSTPHLGWHSPVPYLFGGLAAMLGLIALALLILACSHWKLSGYLDCADAPDEEEEDGSSGASDVEAGKLPVFEEKILVIMAGQVKPTFLATPTSSRFSSFGNSSGSGGCRCAAGGGGVEPEEEAAATVEDNAGKRQGSNE